MSKETELERLSQAQEFFQRYYKIEDSVKVSNENKDYLKTYIHDSDYVTKNFKFKSKIMKQMIGCLAFGLVVFLILFVILDKSLLWIAAVAGGLVFIVGLILDITINKVRLKNAINEQLDINRGINEQIDLLDKQIKDREELRDNYLKELRNRVDFISLDYMKYFDRVREFIENDEAETCEEAVQLLDQQLLMKKMTSIMEKSEKIEPKLSDKERFGDPLELIKKNKKKRKLFSK
ncbi:MAG: hypothetical protein ACI4I6_09620 [Hominimerdicola sp.]